MLVLDRFRCHRIRLKRFFYLSLENRFFFPKNKIQVAKSGLANERNVWITKMFRKPRIYYGIVGVRLEIWSFVVFCIQDCDLK